MHTLTARGDGKQYVARITGRNSVTTFEREYLGRKTSNSGHETQADVDEPGLYEICDTTTGRDVCRFHVLLGETAGAELRSVTTDQAMRIARGLEARIPLVHLVFVDAAGTHVRSMEDAVTRTDATLDGAVARCWTELQRLRYDDAARAIEQLRSRLEAGP